MSGRAYNSDLERAMEQRQRLLRERVSKAIRSGDFWEIIKAEFARDYSSLFDGLVSYGIHIDSDYANPQQHRGTSNNRSAELNKGLQL